MFVYNIVFMASFKNFRLELFFIILSFFVFSNVNCQLTLGDIVFTGMNSDGDDEFSFLLLNNLNIGDSIIFTDNGWSNSSGFRNGESYLKLISNENLSCGDQIMIKGLVAIKQDGAITGVLSGEAIDLNNNGDQIFAFTNNKPTISDMSGFISAIQNNNGWNTSVSSTKSMKPSIFTDGSNSIAFSNHIDNMVYNCSLTSSSDISLIKQFVNNESNWLVNNGQEFFLPNCQMSCNDVPPSIFCPSDTILNVNEGTCEASFFFSEPLCAQNCINADVNQIDLTGFTSEDDFPLGTTTLVYEVSNSSGATTCDFNITVVDNEDPIILCPSDTIVYSSVNNCEVLVNFSLPIISDNCSSEVLNQVDFTGLTSGSLFPFGTTLLEFSVDDSHNNSALCELEITVLDTIPPIISDCPSNLTFPTSTSNCEGQAFWAIPNGFDLCGPVVLTSTHNPGDLFPIGTTIVKYYATDNSGNSDSCSFTIDIIDLSPPALNTISTKSISSVNNCDALIPNYITLFSPVDNCSGAIDLVQKPFPGTVVYGDTVVSVIATDVNGNSDTSSFVVLVNNVVPILNCPSSINIYLDDNCSSILPDISSSIITGGGCSNLTYSQFPISGTTISSDTDIIFTAINSNGVNNSCTISGVLLDTIKPSIICPNDTIVNTNSMLCLNIYDQLELATPIVSDNCMVLFVENDYNFSSSIKNTIFNIGDYAIKWSVRDTANNISECIQEISVVDQVKPSVTCIDTIKSIITTDDCNLNVNVLNPIYSDNCGVFSISNNITGSSLDASDIYPLGLTPVHFTVSDINNNDSTCTTIVLVDDGVLPNLICGSNDTSYILNSSCQSLVSVTEPLNDHPCSNPNFSVTNDYNNSNTASDIYPLGETDVKFTLTNFSGQTTTCSKKIVVLDTLKPDILCKDTLVYVDNNCSVNINDMDPIVFDSCSFSIINDFNNSTLFDESLLVGDYYIGFNVSDLSGNFDECTSLIQVIDTISPVIICSDTLLVYNTISSCDLNLNLTPPLVTDNCSILSLNNDYNNSANASDFYTIDTTSVLWEAVDVNNNSSYCTEVIIIIDTIKPIFTLKPSDTIIYSKPSECGVSYDYINSILPSDNCSLLEFNKLSPLNFNGGDSLLLGTYNFTFEAIDFSYNNKLYNYSVSVLDTFSLELNCPNDTVLCDSIIVYEDYEIVSTCHEELNFTQISGPLSGSVVNPGVYNIVYEIEDIRNKKNQCDFEIEISPVLNKLSMNDTLLCDGSGSISLTAENPSATEFGMWYSNDLDIEFNNNISSKTIVNNLSIGENLIFWEVSNTKCSSYDSVIVTVDSTPTMIEDSVVYSIPKEQVVLDFKAKNYKYFNWYNTTGLSNPNSLLSLASPEVSTSYTLILESEYGCVNTSTIFIEIPDELYVENPTDFFTPNGDGINDTWFLSEKVNEYIYDVKIYNRWGQKIYSDSNYKNNWEGTSNNSLIPEGTYYYEVRVNNQFYTGPISIKR